MWLLITYWSSIHLLNVHPGNFFISLFMKLNNQYYRKKSMSYVSISQCWIFMLVPVILPRHIYVYMDLKNKHLGTHLCNLFAEGKFHFFPLSNLWIWQLVVLSFGRSQWQDKPILPHPWMSQNHECPFPWTFICWLAFLAVRTEQ